MFRRITIVRLLSVLSVTALLAGSILSCSGGGGGNDGGGQVTYTNATQASSSTKAVTGAVTLTSTLDQSSSMASSEVPSYAPKKRGKAVNTDAIAYLDPRLKNVVDKMVADLKLPVIGSAVQKSRSLKTMNATSISISPTTCAGGSGTYSVSGSDTSVPGSYDEDTATIQFTNCRQSTSTTYTVVSGTLQLYRKHLLDNSSNIENMTATNFTVKLYLSDTLYSTDVLNGTFNNTNNLTSGRNDANGSFTETGSGGDIATFSFNNISDVWTSATTTTSGTVTTDEDTLNGSFVFDYSSGGSSIFAMTISLSNLKDKVRTNADLSTDEWIDGSIGLSWQPDLSQYGCVPGTITIGTGVATPIHTLSGAECPASGTVTVNNATIVFGSPVTVTVGSDVKTFSSCTLMGGDSCTF